jgi:hypothetical protein
MSELGNLDVGTPSEGQSGAPEQLSENAKQRFAAAAAAMQAIQREEKKSKKRDSRVARTILQFLNDDRYAHLFVLISRLVARDCPSIFILAILSLINDECRTVVKEYLEEANVTFPEGMKDENLPVTADETMDARTNRILIAWITRMQTVLNLETQQILIKLMHDENNIDGSVLQLSTFVLQEFFTSESGGKRSPSFESLQSLSASILQTVFEPFLHLVKLPTKKKKDEDDED